MSGADRRTFLKRTAMASAAAAASSLFPGVTFGEEVVRYLGDSERSDAALVWRKTPCRFCGVGCGLLVGIEDGRAVAVRGDPDSPVNRGLACVKGYHSVQALYGQDRLRRALVRRGGRLVEVPLQEALDLVAERMRTTIDEHGKDGVAIYGSGQWTIPDGYVASKLFKGALGRSATRRPRTVRQWSARTATVSRPSAKGATEKSAWLQPPGPALASTTVGPPGCSVTVKRRVRG